MNILACAFIFLLFLLPMQAWGKNQSSFDFQSIGSINEMNKFISTHFKLGDPKKAFRKVFVEEGKATLIGHPTQQNVEKYIYDINLCRIYIWRWNISADFDQKGKLLQAYLNGNPIFAEGTPKKIIPKQAETGKKAAIYRSQRPRPEADKGERSLGFILFDRDSDIKTTDDQALMGAGPSRVNPYSMGQAITYIEVELWRSIFDMDAANKIHAFRGNCKG